MTRCYRGWAAPGTTVSCLELAIKAKAEMRGEDKAKDRTRGSSVHVYMARGGRMGALGWGEMGEVATKCPLLVSV